MVPRIITSHLKEMMQHFPVLSLTGPRQSGKTTLLTSAFPDYRYFNLERPDHRQLILEDPMGFLQNAGHKVIFDEAQNLPELFSYIQVMADERNIPGQYVLSGSQSFLMNERISQSLAGRVNVSHLLPFSMSELNKPASLEQAIFEGFYPRLHQAGIHPAYFFPSYVQTYIERDIRALKAIEDMNAFSRFLGLCAGRTGQLVNLSALANDAGIAVNTAKSWLSMLEASFVVFLLQPYHRNFRKRIIKSPKLYFFDTGLACSLLRINDKNQVNQHYLYGALFENLVISEVVKQYHHTGMRPPVYFWRESNGTEIDCIIDRVNTVAMEIKAGQTYTGDFLKNLKKFPDQQAEKVLIYAGKDSLDVSGVSLMGWEKALKETSWCTP